MCKSTFTDVYFHFDLRILHPMYMSDNISTEKKKNGKKMRDNFALMWLALGIKATIKSSYNRSTSFHHTFSALRTLCIHMHNFIFYLFGFWTSVTMYLQQFTVYSAFNKTYTSQETFCLLQGNFVQYL